MVVPHSHRGPFMYGVTYLFGKGFHQIGAGEDAQIGLLIHRVPYGQLTYTLLKPAYKIIIDGIYTMKRLAAMQLCPVFCILAWTMVLIWLSKSASSQTMHALLPPNSMTDGFKCAPAISAMVFPAVPLPVTLTPFIWSWAMILATVSWSATTAVKACSGKAAAENSSWSAMHIR